MADKAPKPPVQTVKVVTTKPEPKAPVTPPVQTAKVVTPPAKDKKDNKTALIISGLLGLILLVAMCVLLIAGIKQVFARFPVVQATQAPIVPLVQNNTPMPEPIVQESADFPLKGLRFPAYADGSLNSSYDLFVEADGRYWQKWLPNTGKVAHSVAFELPEGKYVFNGVVCALHLDVNRNGQGSSNPVVASYGNDLKFEANLPANSDYDTAYALVECDGGAPSGFDIWFLGN